MTLPNYRATQPFVHCAGRKPRIGLIGAAVTIFLLFFPGMHPLLQAKDAVLNAIVLFDGPSGAAYVQISGLLVNGKTELRVCDGTPKFDKHAYDSMPHAQLATATSLERNADGVLMLVTGTAQPMCVVPASLKFDKGAALSTSEAADQALLQGTVVSSSTQQPNEPLPVLKAGVKLIFVAAPDTELAEYLRAQRTNTVPGWRDFLSRYASSAHAYEARSAMASLLTNAAVNAFAAYGQSGPAREFQHLKQAQQRAEQATLASPGYPAAQKLLEQIRTELDTLLEADRTQLQMYRTALAERTKGYEHLTTAKLRNDQIVNVDPRYAPALALQNEIWQETRKMEVALQTADALIAEQRYDDAFNALGAYLSFISEAPHVEQIVNAAYSHHFSHGEELAKQQDWEHAIGEFKAAARIRPDSTETTAALKNAESQLTATRNQQAATQALEQSKAYADNKQLIEAYEVLASLPDGARALASQQMEALSKDYAVAASKRSQKLQELHVPIHGRADEDSARQSYDLLSRASIITGDPAMKLRLDLLSDRISAYYVDVARRYLEKPQGSGVGLGWLYLGEAQRYKPDLDAVKDDMARYAPAWQLRARLSIGILLRDQTSRRENAGFADQLADAIAHGLENSGVSIRSVRMAGDNSAALQPSFVLVAEILQHHVINNTNLETLTSKYRVGTREIRNEAWAQLNQQYETAQQSLTAAQRTLADLQAKNKKKEISAATDAVDAAKKQADDLRHKLDATEQKRVENIIETYNYTRKTIDLNATVELTFRLTDAAGNLIDSAVPVKREDHKTFVLLENVKPEDTEGVKAQNAPPNDQQFLADVEIPARDTLVKALREKIAQLPSRVLQDARTRAQQNDFEGAAAQYILYLNATPDQVSPERDEASKFLQDRFNLVLAKAAK